MWATAVHAHESAVDVGPARQLTLGGSAVVAGTRATYDVSRDGHRLLATIAGDQARVEPIVVVQNWPALLRKLDRIDPSFRT